MTQIGVSISIARAKANVGRGAHRDGILVSAGPARGPELKFSTCRIGCYNGILYDDFAGLSVRNIPEVSVP
jgi:hypothetical protein